MSAYEKVYNHLRQQIIEGHYASGQRLPAERELSEQFGVSRITTRHAVRLLSEQGLVERFQGRGTFIRAIKSKKIPILNTDFTGSIRKEAPDMRRELLSCRQTVPIASIAEQLGLLKSEKCLSAQRLDLLDEEPVAYDKAYIPLKYATSLDENILVKIDFLEVWLEKEKIRKSHSIESIEAVSADEQTSESLNIPKGSPILLTTDVMYDTDGKVFAIFESYYRGDKIKLLSTNTGKVT